MRKDSHLPFYTAAFYKEITDCCGFGARIAVGLERGKKRRGDFGRRILRRILECMMRALIVGYFGFGNLGDEETLSVLTTTLDKYSVSYHILGDTRATSPLWRLWDFERKIGECGAVIFGGGNLLQNESSNASLLFYLYIIRRARALGVPIFFFGGGIGRIGGEWARALTRRALRGVDFFGARTHRDFDALSGAGIKEVIYMPDMCFTLPQRREVKRDIFAYIPRRRTPSVEKKLCGICSASSYTPIIIPFQPERDYRLCCEVAEAIGGEVFGYSDRWELMGKLAACRFSVSDRLHGLIFSLLAYTPSFISDGSEKCRALGDDILALSARLGARSPILPLSELSTEKTKELGALSELSTEKTKELGVLSELSQEKEKELGARDSEFDLIISYLRAASNAAIQRLCERLVTYPWA